MRSPFFHRRKNRDESSTHFLVRLSFGECPAGDLAADLGKQTVELLLDHPVALAGLRFQPWTIHNRDPSSAVVNQLGVL